MHTGKGRLNCDSDASQVGSVWSDSTRVVKVNRRKTNRRKTRPYCISIENIRCALTEDITMYF